MKAMKKTILALTLIGLSLPCLQAQDRDTDGEKDNDRSSTLTPTAPRKVTMANPVKPAWLAEPHGK
jgi:hypothetical protein